MVLFLSIVPWYVYQFILYHVCLHYLPQTAALLSRLLQKDLQTINDPNWHLYGTHSFRRGGAQYRLTQGWSISKVAQWGGWSQLEAITMFRYFYSPSDFDGYMHFFDQNMPVAHSTTWEREFYSQSMYKRPRMM